MKEFLLDIVRQLFGIAKPRWGKIVLTHRAVSEMYANALYSELIQDIFTYGVETRKGMIVKKYLKYIAGLYYKYDGGEDEYRIMFVFKN